MLTLAGEEVGCAAPPLEEMEGEDEVEGGFEGEVEEVERDEEEDGEELTRVRIGAVVGLTMPKLSSIRFFSSNVNLSIDTTLSN